MEIDRYKLVLSRFSCELEAPLDKDARLIIQTEADCYEVAYNTNDDGTHNCVYKTKVVGATEVREAGKIARKVKGKSKRTQSQKLRQALFSLQPDETFYEIWTDKIIQNLEEVIQFLKDK